MKDTDQQNGSNRELLAQLNDLRRDLALLQATIDGQKDTLIFSIDHDYIYRSFNEAFKTATAYAYGTEVHAGLSLFDSITKEDDREKARSNCDRAMNGESHVTVEEYGTIHPLIYETHYNPILSATRDRVIGVSVLSADVTQRVLSEQRIKTLNAELESFTYTAAHDLRVPLRLIDGYAQILAEDYGDRIDEEGHRLIGIINKQAIHMGRLIDDLLNFARLGSVVINTRPTRMRDVVQQALDEILIQRGDDQIDVRIGNLHDCQCDAALVRTVFSNLIANAIKFSSKAEHPVIEIGSELRGPTVIYSVKDNGVGFDMKFSSKLFGLFQKLHKPAEYDGTGVGLAIVQRIIGKHGGKVWFEAEPGKGATFYVSLQA
jgi:signal transduction histidine kinase